MKFESIPTGDHVVPDQESKKVIDNQQEIQSTMNELKRITSLIDTYVLDDKRKEMKNASKVEFLDGSYEELKEIMSDEDFINKLKKLSDITHNINIEQ